MRKLLLAAAALAVLPFAANATLMLSVSTSTGGTLNCTDNDPTCDTNAAIGTLQIADQTIGGLALSGSIQTSQGTTLTGGVPTLDTSSLQIANNTTGTIGFDAAIGDNNFLAPVNTFSISSSATFRNAVGSTWTQSFYDDPANTQGATCPTCAPGDLLGTSTKSVTLIADSTSFSAAGTITDPISFSMTERVSGSLVAGGVVINNGQTEIKTAVIPEPGSLAVLGTGLIGLGMVARRRRQV